MKKISFWRPSSATVWTRIWSPPRSAATRSSSERHSGVAYSRCPESRYRRPPLNRKPPLPGTSPHSRGAGSIRPKRRPVKTPSLTLMAASAGLWPAAPAQAYSVSVPNRAPSIGDLLPAGLGGGVGNLADDALDLLVDVRLVLLVRLPRSGVLARRHLGRGLGRLRRRLRGG